MIVCAPGMAMPLWRLAQCRRFPYTHVALGRAPSNNPPYTREDLTRFRPDQKPASREYYRMLDRVALGFLP